MHKGEKKLAARLTLGILAALFLVGVATAFAQPTANTFGVEDAGGYEDTNVVVPVNITNAQDGPVICLIFDIIYDKSVMTVADAQKGTLTSFWDSPTMNNFAWGTRVLIVYDGVIEHGIQDGSTGSVVLLNLSVIGTPGSTSGMTVSNIQLSDTGYNVGTAPATNGTFSILGATPSSTPSSAPTQPQARVWRVGGGGAISIPYVFSTPPSQTPLVTLAPTSIPTPSQSLPLLQAPSSSPMPTATSALIPSGFGGMVFFITVMVWVFDSVAVTYLGLKWSYLKFLRRSANRP